MIDFSAVNSVTIPEGDVKQIDIDGVTVWEKSAGLIPREYQQVEYIEGSGVQWIDTGIAIRDIGALTTDWNMTFAIMDITRTNLLGGTRDSFDKRVAFIPGDNKIRANDWCVRWSHLFFTEVIVQGQIYTLSQDGGKYKLGSDSYDINSNSLMNSDRHFGLFAELTGDSAVDTGTISHMRLYGFTVSSNSNVLYDFVPCYRKIDGAVGLYETVHGVFVGNSGTGVFLPGHPVIELPADYQLVEYIKTSADGGQWIDTGIPGGNDSLKIVIQYMWDTAVPANGIYQQIVCSQVDSNANATRILQFGPSTTYANHNKKAANSVVLSLNRAVDTLYTESLTHTTYTVNGTSQAMTVTANGNANNTNIFVFASPAGGSPCKSMRMYYVRLFNGSTMVREMIPCYRKSDSEVGMYDTVSRTFFTNAGSGSFSVGSDIT